MDLGEDLWPGVGVSGFQAEMGMGWTLEITVMQSPNQYRFPEHLLCSRHLQLCSTQTIPSLGAWAGLSDYKHSEVE